MARRAKNAAGLPVYGDHAVVVFDQGKPWTFACCGCGLSHDLTICADDADTVRMKVDLNHGVTMKLRASAVRDIFNAPSDTNHPPFCVPVGDANQRTTKMFARDNYPPRPREFVTLDEDDPSAYTTDANGAKVVRDGVKIRCKMTMDAAPPQRSAPMQIRTGLPLRGPNSLARHFYIDGTPKPARSKRPVDYDPDEGDDDYLVEERIDDALRAAASPHRPGFRFADAGRVTVDQGQALKDSAYAEMVADLNDAWKPEHLRAQTAVDAQRAMTDAGRPAGITDADWAREQSIREMCDAWRPRDATDPHEGAQKPQGLYPLGAWPKSMQQEGASCFIDGAPGVWKDDAGDGLLRCRPFAMQATRVPPTNRSTATGQDGGPVGSKQAVEDSYRQMCDELTSAWRT